MKFEKDCTGSKLGGYALFIKKTTRVFSVSIIIAVFTVAFVLLGLRFVETQERYRPIMSAISQIEYMLTELNEHEIIEERYYELLDEEGKLITLTGRRIRPGDRYLNAENKLYEVYRVHEYTAYARFLRTEQVGGVVSRDAERSPDLLNMERVFYHDDLFILTENEPVSAEQRNKLVALYHTHNAESYVPSDGTHSIYGQGGIHQVGRAFKEALEEKDVQVIHSEELHLPHDRGAYRRSRNTVLELLQHDPDVIFDVHRDAAPIDAYAVEIEDEWVTQVQFVVGRQNPSFPVTRQFAYDLKGLADDVYPGLIKGVFLGWGNYNQDLMPLKLLLEVGAHQNSREAAKDGAQLFADVVALYFYGIPVKEEEETIIRPPVGDFEETGAAAAQTVLGIVLLVAAGAGGFYLINNPGSEERVKTRIKEFGRSIYSKLVSVVERYRNKR